MSTTRDVADLTRAGWSEDKIAATLRLSARTIRRHRARVQSQAKAIRKECRELQAELDR